MTIKSQTEPAERSGFFIGMSVIQNGRAGAEIARSGISDRALLSTNECAPMAEQSQSVAELDCIAGTLSVAPWESKPYQLITWWEMDQFSASVTYWAGQIMESLKRDCLAHAGGVGDRDFSFTPHALYDPIDDKTFDKAIDCLSKVEEHCRKIGLQIAADTIQHEVLVPLKEVPPRPLSYQWLLQHLYSLQRLIQREMSNRLFLYVPPEKARYWPQMKAPFAFGERVNKAFPSANFDIHNASICLAASIATAAVFHLMRVLEIVLSVLGNKFGVSLANTNWAPAIEEIESKIRAMHKDPVWKALPDCKEQQTFYSQAASYFGIIKDAWRNHTMHTRGKYTEQEAEHIYNSVKAFTQKLAERLSE
jgi:hypothetical protein